MKKLFIGFTVLMFVSVYLTSTMYQADAAGATSIEVWIDGEKLDSNVQAQVVQDRTVVPIRLIAEKWGAAVGWNEEHRQVRIMKDGFIIDLFIDNPAAKVNGEQRISDVPPLIKEGRTMLPLRFVGELLGADVAYNSQHHRVLVTLPKEPSDSKDVDEPKPQPEPPEVEDGIPALRSISLQNQQLKLLTTEGIKPNVFYLSNPDRIVMDIPGTKLDVNAISQNIAGLSYNEVSHQYKFNLRDNLIQSVRFAENDKENSTIRIVIDLKGPGAYQLQQAQNGEQTLLQINHGAYKVVIDAGHGDHDPGAHGTTGYLEKDFNLALSKEIARQLQNEPFIEPILTRSTDVFIELQDRAQFANDLHADAFVSIHGNAFMPSSRGTETFYTHDYQRELAAILHKHLVAATGFPDRKLQRMNFSVTRNTDMPAALLETGFLTNTYEESLMKNAEFRQKVAAAIVRGLKEYFEL